MSTTLMACIHDQVILEMDDNAKRADIWAYLCSKIDCVQVKHSFGKCISEEWPTAFDLETIVKKSRRQFIYASMIIRYIELSKHSPHYHLQHILEISSSNSGEDPFAELNSLYQALMSPVRNILAAIKPSFSASILFIWTRPHVSIVCF